MVSRRWNRRQALGLLLAAGCTPYAVKAQTTKRRVIGGLAYDTQAAAKWFVEAFRKELEKLGWVDGGNVHVHWLYAGGDVSRHDSLATELVSLKPDVLFAVGDPTTLALQRATREIPIVFSAASNPVALGLVQALNRPGGNITGFSANPGPEIVGKRLGLLKEWFSSLSRLAVLMNPGEPGNRRIFENYQHHGPQLGIQVSAMNIRNTSEIESEFARLSADSPQALYVLHSALVQRNLQAVSSHAVAARLPTMCSVKTLVQGGLLFSYAIPLDEYAKQGARYVDRVLRGAKPAEIPVEQPTRFELVINMKTAQALGLTVPSLIRLRADQLIE